jgi:tRNA-Thr(GGU) m(6)t(6)A37 methyltransferase TsaA
MAGIEMTSELPGMTLEPIGIVRKGIKRAAAKCDWEKVVSDIIINTSLTEALDGLEESSHVIVLYWMHQAVSGEVPLKVHPRGKQELPLSGLFATRTPNRPNRIGIATVRLLERQGNILRVEGLDAIGGTPVIDIKPYIPGYDSVANTKVPPWITNQ